MRTLPDSEVQTGVTILIEAGDAPVRPQEVLKDFAGAEVVWVRDRR
jgi:hypothetical protein